MKNNTLTEIFKRLDSAESILFLTHVIIDGDSAGSAMAIAHTMSERGKTAHVFTGEKLPDNLAFLRSDDFIWDKDKLLPRYDIVMAVDCSDEGRFENRADLWKRGDLTINVDHHGTNSCYADMNYVDSRAAAVGEIIYEMLFSEGIRIDREAAKGIYTAVVTDTGQFQYSNTTPSTHRTAAALLEAGIDLNSISVEIYQNVRKEKYVLQAEILGTMELGSEGRFAFAHLSRDMLDKTGCELQDSDGIVELLRNINTVEVSCFAKETAENVFKVGFRSKYDVDVAAISAQFGGGGHKKAAGCTIKGTIEEVKAKVYHAASKVL